MEKQERIADNQRLGLVLQELKENPYRKFRLAFYLMSIIPFLVFPNSEGNLLHKNKIRDKMHEICEKVGIAKATPHDLRHTFASRPELSSKTKQEIGGWSSKQVMEKTYNNPPENIIRDEYFKVSFIPKAKD